MATPVIPAKLFHVAYHDVRPESCVFTKWINSTIAPAEFEDHMRQLQEIGSVCPAEDFLSGQIREDELDRPHFVVWFDDAFQGVAEHAFPICQSLGIRPTVAVTSAIVNRQERFWRCELSYLLERMSPEALNRELFPNGENATTDARQIWRETLENYDRDLRERMRELFEHRSNADEQQQVADVFMTDEQVAHVTRNGWALTNHSATHPAITPNLKLESTLQDFRACSEYLTPLGGSHDVWVVPFDYGLVREEVGRLTERLLRECGTLVRAHYLDTVREREVFRVSIHAGREIRHQIADAIGLTQPSRARRFWRRIRRWARRATN